MDKHRGYLVVLNGETVAIVRDGQSIEVENTTGKNELYLRVDWCRSPVLGFDLQVDETIELECGNSLSGLKLLMTPLYLTVLRAEYLFLHQIE
ncbi:MAG TPA: hypothetical protein VI876_11020 [Dehalococcoidia bacterium]|jgi:hypothetical protein|nr:hypothetical protein [Dehalococcoidia bacterium]